MRKNIEIRLSRIENLLYCKDNDINKCSECGEYPHVIEFIRFKIECACGQCVVGSDAIEKWNALNG